MATGNVKRFRFEGVNYEVDLTSITGKMERELWKSIGMSPMQAIDALGAGASFGLAVLLWVARVQRGDRVTYEQVEGYLDGLDKGEVDLEFLPDVEDDEVPQPSGAGSDT